MADAMQKLRASQAAGLLYIITNEHACGGGVHPRRPVVDDEGNEHPFDAEACAAFGYRLQDPRHFVAHKVEVIEGPDRRGYVRAYSADGDMTMGEPEALLQRLLQYAMAGS
jgi:hypothetical protein